jgi:hypothetical protein
MHKLTLYVDHSPDPYMPSRPAFFLTARDDDDVTLLATAHDPDDFAPVVKALSAVAEVTLTFYTSGR